VIGQVEFDHIAPFYDETRPAPNDEELEALSTLLSGSRTLLDAGVGTGRFAVPLRARSFEVIGADLSLAMMRRASAKGIGSLVRADVRRLPFRDASVDAGFLAHVLQLIPDPRPVLAELGRVTRRTVVVLLPEWSEGRPARALQSLRARYRAIAEELGYPLPKRGERYHHSLASLSEIAPPRSVRIVTRSRPAGRTLEERLSRWETLAFGKDPLPPEVHAEIVRRLVAERGPEPGAEAREGRMRFVAWDSADLRPPPPAAQG
jgi:ubiquinone/menaquinone biosynthesis C-methylase UbiE